MYLYTTTHLGTAMCLINLRAVVDGPCSNKLLAGFVNSICTCLMSKCFNNGIRLPSGQTPENIIKMVFSKVSCI